MPEGMLAGTPAYWRVDGDGARSVMMLHCTMAHSGAWKGVMGRLADACTMVAMDLPGHGRSGPWDRGTSWQRQSTDMVLELLKHGDLPADLIGHSFGATVALRIAVTHPELVRSLTLIEPVFFSAAKDAGRAEYDDHRNLHKDFHDLLEAGDFPAAARAFNGMWGDGAAWDAMPERQRIYMTERIEMILEGGKSIWGDGPDYIPLTRVAGITVPVLLIEGGETDPVIPAILDSLDAVLTTSKHVSIAGAGHMAPITHPAEVAAEIRDYFNF